MTKALMIQGTGSNVGKSVLVAGLCRAAKLRGLKVAPFKPQNMSNNAAVTLDGGEIGRAQALQALACGLEPHTDMNPVLLKPESETGAQIIVQGKRLATAKARDYTKLKPSLLPSVLDSFNRLKSTYDLVLVEGAGSPAEVNLRDGDIANMGFAIASNTPVVLAGDIDRGGVIAQIIGTQAVLPDQDKTQIKAFLVNKFRGDVSLFDDGNSLIETRTGWTSLGILPWFPEAHKLPAEDALDIRNSRSGDTHIVCLKLNRIANFDDLDPLVQEPGIRLTMLPPGAAIPGDAKLVIIPGSKSTRADLDDLRAQGWDIDLRAHYRRGGFILGLCGGYQMLGQVIHDPDGIEGAPGTTEGLGFLDTETTMQAKKHLTDVTAIHTGTGLSFSGYEIHIGETSGPDCARPFATLDARTDGAQSKDGRVIGSYFHGMFRDDAFRSAFLTSLDAATSNTRYSAAVEDTLDKLARHLETHIDLNRLFALAS